MNFTLPSANAKFAPPGWLLLALTKLDPSGAHSRQLVMDPAARGQQLDRVRDYLTSRPETARGEFRMPMLTGVLRSVKI